MEHQLDHTQVTKIVVVSGFFNPLHVGHLNMFEEAKSLGNKLIVIVNNDNQQIQKKGKIILTQEDRKRIVQAIRVVDEAISAIDEDNSVSLTLRLIKDLYPGKEIVFANGGDRKSEDDIAERDTCNKCGIIMKFGVGGFNKIDSSTRINKATGDE